MDFVHTLEHGQDRQTLLIPTQYVNEAMSKFAAGETEDDDMLTMPRYKSDDQDFLSLVHVALKIRSDMVETPGHTGLGLARKAQ
jgi:hypothetical protein